MQLEELQQLAPAGVAVEIPGRATAQAAERQHHRRPAVFVGNQDFRRRQAREFRVQQILVGDFRHQESAAGKIGPGQAEALPRIGALAARDCQQQGVAAFLQQGLVGHRPGRHDAHDFALDQSLRQRGVTDLFADRDRFAEGDQSRQVALDGMHGHARHRNRLSARGAALGQGDVEQAGRLARIVIEQFVEIAHPEEQQDVRMLGLGREELAHEGRVFLGIASHEPEPSLSKRLWRVEAHC